MANLRLGMILEMFTTTGGLVGILVFQHTNDPVLQAHVRGRSGRRAVVMLMRLDVRNVNP